MTRWQALVEYYNLPTEIYIKVNSETLLIDTGDYINDIVAELRRDGKMFDMHVAAKVLYEILKDGTRDANFISERYWQDEPSFTPHEA